MSIFVFGSNLAGVHGAGAARDALDSHGAKWGVGVGISGKSYAIPTKDRQLQSLSLIAVAGHVREFCEYARQHNRQTFYVTRIGCGLAGFKDSEIGPLFADVPKNCIMPAEWKDYLDSNHTKFHSWDNDHKM